MEIQALESSEERLFDERFGQSPVPIGIQIDPAGKRAFVANTLADCVTVLDLTTGARRGASRPASSPTAWPGRGCRAGSWHGPRDKASPETR